VAALEIGRPVLTFAAALVEYFAELEKCLLPFGIPRTNLNLHHQFAVQCTRCSRSAGDVRINQIRQTCELTTISEEGATNHVD